MDIFGALLGVPRLAGAQCAGLWTLFDEAERGTRDRADNIEYAIQLCGLCDALADCRDWYESLPPDDRPTGVVAGQLRTFTLTPRPQPHPANATAAA